MFRAIKTACGPDISLNFNSGDLREIPSGQVNRLFDAGAIVPVKAQMVNRVNPDTKKAEVYEQWSTDEEKLAEMTKASEKRKPKPELEKVG